jgi:hypothetical protein
MTPRVEPVTSTAQRTLATAVSTSRNAGSKLHPREVNLVGA